MRVHACVRDVFPIYDNDILPMLIMIITKIIILYVTQDSKTSRKSQIEIVVYEPLTSRRSKFANLRFSHFHLVKCIIFLCIWV